MRRPNAPHSEPDPISKPDPNPDQPTMQPIKSLQFTKPRQNSQSKTLKFTPKSNFISISLLSASISIAIYVIFSSLYRHSPPHGRHFRVIIDGGSTGSRVHVFEYQLGEDGVPLFDFGDSGHGSMRVSPGLSSFGVDPTRAGESLVELIEFAKRRVPSGEWGVTEIRLMGTAGLRMVEVEVRELILENCRKVLRSSGFLFRDDWVSVITGSDEGLYAWVVANYALGTLGGDPLQTTGIIELGGASAQVTFVSSESLPTEFARTLEYGNTTYNLYSNSLLHFGQNVAFDALKDLLASTGSMSTESAMKKLTLDPCTPRGYALSAKSYSLAPDSLALEYSSSFHATGNFSECRAAALTLLQRGKESCMYHHCSLGATFLPKLKGKFLATENFFHTSQFLGLTPKSLLSDLMMAGQQFCEDDWMNIRSKHSSHEEADLLNYCFSSAYIVALLHDSLGIPLNDGRIECTNRVENIPLDWALGAFILQTTGAFAAQNHRWISSIIDPDFLKLSLLVAVSIFLFFLGCYTSQWRKPYFKTIYDLEKGRYIVTRIRK